MKLTNNPLQGKVQTHLISVTEYVLWVGLQIKEVVRFGACILSWGGRDKEKAPAMDRLAFRRGCLL